MDCRAGFPLPNSPPPPPRPHPCLVRHRSIPSGGVAETFGSMLCILGFAHCVVDLFIFDIFFVLKIRLFAVLYVEHSKQFIIVFGFIFFHICRLSRFLCSPFLYVGTFVCSFRDLLPAVRSYFLCYPSFPFLSIPSLPSTRPPSYQASLSHPIPPAWCGLPPLSLTPRCQPPASVSGASTAAPRRPNPAPAAGETLSNH